MSEKTKQVEVKKETLPVISIDFEADSANEFDNIGKEDTAIPFLKILQTNSPECDESNPEYIPGAKAGLFLNTVTKELIGNTVDVIPVADQRIYNKWAEREKGGGYKGVVAIASEEVKAAKQDDRGRLVLDSGDYLVDTRNHFIIALYNDKATPMLLPLTSTQVKKSRNWIGRMMDLKLKNKEGKKYTPPRYSHIYTLSTLTEKNDKGSWKGLKIDLKGVVEDIELYNEAKQFAALVKSEKVKVQEPVSESEENF